PSGMSRDAIAFALAGTFFGLLVGWMIGSQQGRPAAPAVPTSAQAAPASGGGEAAPPFDARRAAELEQQASERPRDAAVRAELGNLHFDAGQYDQAARWYELALAIEPRNVDVSTDLAVAYYYTQQA